MGVKPTGPGLTLLVLTSVCMVLATGVVGLRLLIRLKLRQVGLDDWLMFIGFVIYMATNSTIFLGIHHGMGARMELVSEADDLQGRKWFLLSSFAYTICIVPLKCSICVQLLRITSRIKRIYAFILYGVMIFTTVAMVARIIAWVTRCTPFNATWDNSAGTCQPPTVLLRVTYFFSAVCILGDWVCAILPIFMLWKVQFSLSTKLQVGFVLSLGALASIATCVRFKYFNSYLKEDDYLYAVVFVSIWAQIETALAIIAGSLPALRPILRNASGFFTTAKYTDQSYKMGPPTAISKANKKSQNSHLDTYMGQAISGDVVKADLENDVEDSASQTYILSEDRNV
ncbi:hypothetical protein BDV95DRAFT_622738 [Massariosphaeria phaeospora]|uniref:Rhodopsin domain-containing protein n=1 Tax=Massariosphaeria phaeospora TaxID=100035 RepID=A0A7C8HZW6_9PLEO|nr:hypothetical protein BDV95DRAFT_622738 [Massariosphaeria phaeospora]